MPPRATAKPRATRAKAPASPEPSVVEEAPEPVDVEEDDLDDDGPISLTARTEEGAVKADLVEIFDVDGQAFFLDKARPVQVVLNGMWVARSSKLEPVGAMEFIKAVLGEEALTALRSHRDFDTRILYRVVNKIMKETKGGSEPGKS